ncbi:MAG: hypothetical protein FWF50_05620 [Defluviitaleaceae bacterium]|nr:hypothetical protein [Defluviitaleaceae bacterium]
MVEKMKKITLACHKLHEENLTKLIKTYPFHIDENIEIKKLFTNFISFSSFLSEYYAENLEEDLKNEPYILIELEEPENAPTLLKNSKFSTPFEFFTHIYGTPNYKELDPTSILAIFYTVLFGIMFGDVGQGTVIIVLGFFHIYHPLGQIAVRIGISSIFFGLAFGSVFGFHMWNSVIEANSLLIASAFLGVLIYFFGIFLNIYNNRSLEVFKPKGIFLSIKSILTFATSSLSFIRVGAFVLSHSAIMAFVSHLPNIALIAIGNVVIMGIEILVVGIQALRLCYYELFSRFYKANGIKFKTWSENI